jgi:hypothetical protein
MVNHLMQYGFTGADAGPATLGVLYHLNYAEPEHTSSD